MATALQQQLAAINAKSTNQLDLKAQKARHSQSLLFEPKEAAAQTFSTIFQICQQGYTELCQLDRRFVAFNQNLFEDNSVSIEREHMTESENKQLDIVIDQFLGLISGRLLLRPAQKCMEWLVRRWRIHEHNTTSMLYAMLPFHGHEIFATVMSILPERLPTTFQFLRPYVQVLRCPPRHVLVTAAAKSDAFIRDFSTFVLATSRKRLQSSVLIGSWVSILAQSLNTRLDEAQSGRDEVRRQRYEDVLLSILPTLQDMLAIGNAPDIYLAACMLMTILATKVDLDEKVLDAFMESVVNSWSPVTLRDGVECLALLAEEKEDTGLSQRVFKATLTNEGMLSAIFDVSDRIRTDKLLSGLLEAAVTPKAGEEFVSLDIAEQIVQHLRNRTISPLLQSKLAAVRQAPAVAASSELAELLDQLTDASPLAIDEDVEMDDVQDMATSKADDEDLIAAVNNFDAPTGNLSFLSSNDTFKHALSLFERCSGDEAASKAFITKLGTAESCLAPITFLARCWSSTSQSITKRSALGLANELISTQLNTLDLQAVHPYIFVALADGNAQVRRAAAKLAATIAKMEQSKLVWAKTTVYGDTSGHVKWLAEEQSSQLIKQSLKPRLEECILDRSVLKTTITAYLNSGDVKLAQRAAQASYLASHALTSPVQSVQATLLDIISSLGKSANEARLQILTPFVKDHLKQPSAQVNAVIRGLTHRQTEEIQTLKLAAQNDITAAYERLTQIFTSAKPEAQLDVISWLFSRAVGEADSTALETLRNIKLPVDELAHLLSLGASRAADERPSKRQRVGKFAADKPDTENLDSILRQASTCLEIVEDALSNSRQTADDQQYAHLVKQLFSLLGDVQSWRSATGSDLTYLQVLTLNNILATLNYSNAKAIDRSHLRTDMVVETLRSTSSPQVHNSALLVISKIATFAPDTVLHSVMPLFTFMSSSTLRQVDAYSVHVINMTIESIVPPLRESLKARGKDLVAGASDLLLSFSAAFEHIPGTRRYDTFVQLLRVLGPEESLYAVLAMLVERYHEDNTLIETLRGIINSFSAEVQLRALSQYLDLVLDACKKRRNLSDTILGFSEKNAAEANSSVAMLLDGWANLITSPSLQGRVSSELRKDNAQAMRDVYSTLLEKLVALPHSSMTVVKFDEPTLKSAHDEALNALLALLPTEEFITSSAGLMQAGSEQTRVKVFASLTHRVAEARSGDTKLAEIFLETLPNCSVFVSETQPVPVRRAALDCVDAIIEKFGKRDRQAVSEAAQSLISTAALLSTDGALQTASLICLASSIEVLGEEFVAVAGQVLETALKLGADAVGSTPVNWVLVDGVFTLINSVLDHQAWLLSAGLLDKATVLASQAQQVAYNKSTAVQQYYQLLPAQVPLRDLISSLNRSFKSVTAVGESAILARARLIQASITKNTKSNVTKAAEQLTTLILNTFTLRSSSEADGERHQAYQLSVATALDATLKLNDLTFRPLFMKIAAWAEGSQEQSQLLPNKSARLTVLFDFAQRLFDQLGSIVTSYASFVLDQAKAVLVGARSDADWTILASTVLQALTASFKHDQDDFWSAPQHLEAVAQPLLDLLSNPIDGYQGLVTSTIVELTAAVSASSEHLKSINAQIMLVLRHQSAIVRLGAVKCERQITERLTFDWLNLLPEMLPYISELLEDDDEAVEREVLGWVAQIEEVTGESLEGMLA